MDSETGTEIDRQGEEDKEKHRHRDRDWGQGQKYGKRDRGTGTEGQGWKDRDGRTGMEGQEERDRDRQTGMEALRKGQRNVDSYSGTWTRSGTERQGQDHKEWDERQEQVQTEGHQ